MITSYGRSCVFMFCGGPSVDNYAKNLTDFSSTSNPYLTPTAVSTAIRFTPNMKDLANYKFRGLQDGAFIYEGYCVLPKDAVQKVKMVPDLVRDTNGFPIKDDNGEYSVAFREALLEELSEDKTTYNARQDYLQYMKEKAIEYGYLHRDGSPKSKIATYMVTLFDVMRMEVDVSRESIRKNGLDVSKSLLSKIKGFFQQGQTIEKSAEECLQDFSFKGKNPYRDKRLALAVAGFQSKEGLAQLDLQDVLSDFSRK